MQNDHPSAEGRLSVSADPAFRAFTFVDRIVEFSPGLSARGLYTIPADLQEFPMALVAEAVGQLAAWSAMAKLDFRVRPVAGIAGAVTLLGEVFPNDTLELSANIESAEEDAVVYHGSASVNGREVIRLERCVGPMLPQEKFDDPAVLAERLSLLRSAGRGLGGFLGTAVFSRAATTVGETMCAELVVPATADFFGDHFPRRPVFPGTLLMHENFRLAIAFVTARSPGGWVVSSVEDVKLRAFITPGEVLTLQASCRGVAENIASVKVTTKSMKRVISSATVHLTRSQL